jgi:predicted ATPase
VVSGEPGIGKSALVEALAAEAEAHGDEVVQGRAWELGEAPPYFPVWAALRALGLAPPKGAVAEGDAFFLWERVLEALGRASRPVVWILEDLHAADAATLDLLVYLARPLRALRLLLLVTLRDRDPRISDRTAARLARLARDGRELRLGPLEGAELERLVAGVAGRGLAPARLAELCELSGGNPLFAIECARAARDHSRDRDDVRLPGNLRTLINERVAGLGAAARELLACGAILGRDFQAAAVAHMKGALPAQVIEPLQAALRAGLLQEPRPGSFRFPHILIRDAIEAELSASARATLHDLAARALEADGAPGVDVLVERARHALLALRPDGVALAERAAERLLDLGAPDRALALFARLEEAAATGIPGGRATGAEALRRAAVARAPAGTPRPSVAASR